MQAIEWNPRGHRREGGVMVFISGRKGKTFRRIGPLPGFGNDMEIALARRLHIRKSQLKSYLRGRTVYAVPVHPLHVSRPEDRP